MKPMFHEEISRLFKNKRWLIVGILALLVFLMGSYLSQKAINDANIIEEPLQHFLTILYYSQFHLITPLIATVLYSDAAMIDHETGFSRFIYQRIKKQHYQNGKFIAVGLAGGLSLSFSTLLIAFMSFLFVFSRCNFSFENCSFVSGSFFAGPFSALLYSSKPFYFIYLLICGFLYGACFSWVGLAVSIALQNRFAAIASPIAGFWVWSFLVERSNHLPASADPLQGLTPWNSVDNVITIQTQLVQIFGMMALAYLLYKLALTRRIFS